MAATANELKLYMEFWDFPQTVEAFKRIKEWLKSQFRDDEYNVKSLLSFTVKLLQFQEDHFKNAPPMMRIPIKFFMDLEPGRALCVMLNVALGFCGRHGWNWTEFEGNAADEVMDMFRAMQKALIDAGLFKLPTIHLRSEIDDNVRRGLIAIAERRGLSLVDCEDSASHILYPYPELLEEGSTKVIMKQEGKILVHWCYLPESYNAWYNVETFENIEGGNTWCSKRWRLSLAWLTTSDKYGEWMDEEDYQVDEQGRKIKSVGVSLEQVLKPVETSGNTSPFWHDHNYSWLPELSDVVQEETFRPTVWTPREILRLFEAVETYRDDWLSVGAYVGTRDPHDCLLFFLRYPIEDAFLENSWQISGRHFDEGNLPYPAEQMVTQETEKIKRCVLQADVLERKMRCLKRLQNFVDASFGCSQYFQEVYVAEALRSNPEMFEPQ